MCSYSRTRKWELFLGLMVPVIVDMPSLSVCVPGSLDWRSLFDMRMQILMTVNEWSEQKAKENIINSRKQVIKTGLSMWCAAFAFY